MTKPNNIVVTIQIPRDAYEKLLVVSKMDNVTVSDIASQAIQEWLQMNFGNRVPGNS